MAVAYAAPKPKSVLSKAVKVSDTLASFVKNSSAISKMGMLGLVGNSLAAGYYAGEYIAEKTANLWLPYFVGDAPASALSADTFVQSVDNATTIPSHSLTLPKDLAKTSQKALAQAKTIGQTSKAVARASTVPVAGGSLLDIMAKASANSSAIAQSHVEVLSKNLSLGNELASAQLLYLDVIANALSEIAISAPLAVPLAKIAEGIGTLVEPLALGASASIDSAIAKAQSAEMEGIFMGSVVAYANSARVVSDYAQTETAIRDLDGVAVATARPMEMTAIKDATTARTRTDVNNEEFDDIDIPLLDSFPLLSFASVSSAFDKDSPISGNPFAHKNI